MQDKPLFFLVILAGLVVLAILATGIGGFARGGEFNRKHGNRLMRWRIIAQAIAVALIMLFIWMRSS
ncbi:twin transmembrane helix small protein [Paracoccus saliphilus]|uniref:Hypoxia induced protein conserved region n=1 Tax=Paracoccus saliphilus TaxID=405559 RepID=A0AA46A6W1_9RHOB|nr:twin transmembrane helix small protein [Paracoccus saliphilus]WCR02822.1 twin transmembrane helix small protein [Paracoccus saliphilus]SIT04050.1 Hypoxia induced protein conserved region [Paracoccus saliphilus]